MFLALKSCCANFSIQKTRGNTHMATAHRATEPLAAQTATTFAETPARNEAHSSGVSWAAVFAGAFVAAALSLILLTLGTGLGLSSVSPWSGVGASASTVGMVAIFWLILNAGHKFFDGGYLAGRLRTKWAHVHTDEVYFRDTAHGFLMWAVGLVIAASFLATTATTMMGSAGRASGESGPGIMAVAPESGRTPDPNEYYIDSLFRSTAAIPAANRAAVRDEAGLIFANGLRQGTVPASDKTYLAQLVAARTGISEPEAERRVSNSFAEAQQAADTARKALAHLSLWLFVALLIGAFCASYAATIGGRQRDHVVAV
jgi:hypothetical protein